VVLIQNPTYLKIVSRGKWYNAHIAQNNIHYPVGSKVEFSVYMYAGIPSAKITKLVNPKEALQFFEELHKELPAYQVFKLEDIWPSVSEFARTRGLKYLGPVIINEKTRYLFK